ncbi:S41 family peptidase [Flavobacterium sp.]|uniref:S41 family peptidase n=1 Tax=Flavobacterium sp. TaxID=239 RepID=UPI00374CD4E5
MRKFLKHPFLLLITLTAIVSCTDNDDNPSSVPIQDFIWKGLNTYYLYQTQVPDLSDTRFSSQVDLDNYLLNSSSPESFFESLIFDRQNTDKYSVLFSNYIQLEELLQGTSKNNGVEYGLAYKTGSTTDIFGWVKYIMPNSDASTKAIQRGTIFSAVNGTPLTISNYRNLLNQDNYTLTLADYDGGNITPNGQSVTLTKAVYTENPVLLKNTHIVGSRKIGYLVYNGFYSNFETELNNAFAYLKGENVTDLVLDLRYNSGGSIATATRLASMITGQFDGQLFTHQEWNAKLQSNLNPNDLNNNFTSTLGNGSSITSLNLSKVYILTTKTTASASELVINCLKPYINVVHIGTKTTGKNVGSITLYDSPNFRRQGANPDHTYAMQPIVLKTVNASGFGDYAQGITPDNATNVLPENLADLGVLGDPNELLLAKVLNVISLGGRHFPQDNYKVYEEIIDKSVRDLDSEMYLEKNPRGL